MPPPVRPIARLSLAGLLSTLAGCFTIPTHNPDYPASHEQIEREYQRLLAEPSPLARPVVVLNGYHAPWWQAEVIRRQVADLTGTPQDRVIAVSYFWLTDIGRAVDAACQAVEARFPNDDPAQTIEVDVVGLSMGGIVARAAAIAPEPGCGRKRLNIKRLYTLATPHRGATLAEHLAPDAAARDLRPGSALLQRLDDALATANYPLVCYACLRDDFVGATRAAPPGRQPIWVPGQVVGSHQLIGHSRRVMVDLARRLRDQEPWGFEGAAPPRD